MTPQSDKIYSFNYAAFVAMMQTLGDRVMAPGTSPSTEDILAFRGLCQLHDDYRRAGLDPYSDRALQGYRALCRHEREALSLVRE